MELKHAVLLKNRLEDKLVSVKTDRDEMVCYLFYSLKMLLRYLFYMWYISWQERLYLAQLAELENLSASAPRSEPLLKRQQFDFESLQKK